MKKVTICAVCVLLLCGGLLCVHLTAQTGRTASVSLLDLNIGNQSERELLELKVASHRKLADHVAGAVQVGSPAGSSVRLAEVHAGLAAAEIELYRHTGERDKLLVALQSRVDALSDKLRAVTMGFEADRVTLEALCNAEIQLLDALLEQKRVRAVVNNASN